MTYKIFTIISIVEGPTRSQDNDNIRLVCLSDTDETIVFWGSHSKNTLNIDRISQSTFPLKIGCDCILPEDWSKSYGHDWWIPEGSQIDML